MPPRKIVGNILVGGLLYSKDNKIQQSAVPINGNIENALKELEKHESQFEIIKDLY